MDRDCVDYLNQVADELTYEISLPYYDPTILYEMNDPDFDYDDYALEFPCLYWVTATDDYDNIPF